MWGPYSYTSYLYNCWRIHSCQFIHGLLIKLATSTVSRNKRSCLFFVLFTCLLFEATFTYRTVGGISERSTLGVVLAILSYAKNWILALWALIPRDLRLPFLVHLFLFLCIFVSYLFLFTFYSDFLSLAVSLCHNRSLIYLF